MNRKMVKAHIAELGISFAIISIYVAVFSQMLGGWLE